MSDDGALRAPASVSGVNETSSSGRSGSALEHALEASSRAGVREQAAQRALGGGNVLYDPLGVFLAGERAVASVAGSIEDASDTRGASPGETNVVAHEKPAAAVAASAVRHRAIDDVILRECASARDGVRQVVVINAGFGTRPYRLALPDVTWFEVDAMEVLLLKRHLIRAAGGGEKRKLPRGAAARRPARTSAGAGSADTPFAHLATPSVREVKLVGFDVAKELSSKPERDASANRDSSSRAFQNRLAAVLKNAGFETRSPCVFVVEDALTHLEPLEARCLMRSLNGLAAPGSVLVVAGIPRRVARWARRRVKAALGSSSSSSSSSEDSDATRLAETVSRWRCDLERAVPKHARPSFPFGLARNGWARSVSCSLATHARAYGAAADPDVHRADAERVVEFKKKPRGFFAVPGAPGVWFFPVRPKTLASACAPRVLRKTPILSGVFRKLNLPDVEGNGDAVRAVKPRGPPATSGAFNAAALALFPQTRDGGASRRFARSERAHGAGHRGVGGAARRALDGVFGSGWGRALVVAASVLLGQKYGDDITREVSRCAATTRDAGRSALVAGRRFADETIGPVLDETIAPFLNRHVAARLPGDAAFGRGAGGGGKGGAKASKPKPKPKPKPKAPAKK